MQSPELKVLVEKVGNFIDYWGFKEIEGKIWCLTYLSENPLGPNDYISVFSISKSLVSMSVKRLIEYNVLIDISKPECKAQKYVANQDLTKVIKGVLRMREDRMLSEVELAANQLIRSGETKENNVLISMDKVRSVKNFTRSAKDLLEFFIFDTDSFSVENLTKCQFDES